MTGITTLKGWKPPDQASWIIPCPYKHQESKTTYQTFSQPFNQPEIYPPTRHDASRPSSSPQRSSAKLFAAKGWLLAPIQRKFDEVGTLYRCRWEQCEWKSLWENCLNWKDINHNTKEVFTSEDIIDCRKKSQRMLGDYHCWFTNPAGHTSHVIST